MPMPLEGSRKQEVVKEELIIKQNYLQRLHVKNVEHQLNHTTYVKNVVSIKGKKL